jgi:tetratricopeptide (TPR) repeat protein
MKRRPFFGLLVPCVLIALGGGAAGAQTPFPSLEPDPKAALYAGASSRGGYSWEDLAEISLWASGADPVKYMDRIRDAAAELASDPGLSGDPAEKGEYILSFIHKKFLKSYSLLQTRIDTLLENGRYNCVSSAALYLVFAQSAGLDAGGVMTKDHAFVTVRAGGALIDVETTNPYGFDPGNRKEFHNGFGRATGFAYVPAKNYRDRSAITPLELVSLILSNRIADLEGRGRFAEAVPLAINRAALLEGRRNPTANSFFEDPRRDLLNRIFNFGASLLKSGREEDALRWAEAAGPAFPEAERWREFINAAVNNRLLKFMQQKRMAEARDFLVLNAPVLSGEQYGRFDAMVLDAEISEKAQAVKDAAEAGLVLDAIALAEKRAVLPAERIGAMRTFVVGKASSFLAAPPARDWPAAIAYLEKAMEAYGANRQWEQLAEGYRSNYAAEYHNRFADAWNRRNFEDAQRILDEGLGKFPDNRQLLADKRTMERANRR